jgi:hypothetical protein
LIRSGKPNPHHILTPVQEKVLDVIFVNPLAREGFALAGGTALSEFYFGHRLSKDLDIFGLKHDQIPLLADDLMASIPDQIEGATVSEERRSQSMRRLWVKTPLESPLQVDVGGMDLPLLSDMETAGNINILSLDDLALGKLSAASSRVEIRDALDLWELSQHGVNLELVREQMVSREPGLDGYPLGLVDMLNQLERVIEKVEWPRIFVDVKPPELSSFVHELSETFTVAIARDAQGRSLRFRRADDDIRPRR